MKHQKYNSRLEEDGLEFAEDFRGSIKKEHKIRCKECGEVFERILNSQFQQHLGCPGCKRLEKAHNYEEKLNEQDFEFVDIHDYDGSIKKKYELKCQECNGTFERKLENQIYREEQCPHCKEKRREEKTTKNLREQGFELLDKLASTKHKKHLLQCQECGHTFKRYLNNQINFEHTCPSCSPNHQRSQQEDEIANFIQEHGVEVQKNVMLDGLEFDVYCPEQDVAIEYHGLYWHSELFKDKNYHQRKYEVARQNNTQLIQFFQDEWRDKKEICKSSILHTLNKTPNTIYARNCKVVELNVNADYKYFFEENHIQGSQFSKKAIVLVNDGEIVSGVSLRKSPSYDAKEIVRFCNKKFTHVPGALSKLLAEIDEPLVTYVDLAFGGGSGYENCGFEERKKTSQQYWYVDPSFSFRIPRQNVQATDDKSERQVANERNLVRIYGTRNKLLERM